MMMGWWRVWLVVATAEARMLTRVEARTTGVPTAQPSPAPSGLASYVPSASILSPTQLTPRPTGSPTYGPTTASSKNPFDVSKVEWPEIESTAEINGLACVVLVLLFEWKRRKHWRVYSPRWAYYRDVKKEPERVPEVDEAGGFLSWIATSARVEDDEMRKMIGLDAFVLLRFCRMWKRVFFWASVTGLAVLVPVYATGLRKETGFYKLTMRNLKPGQQRLWAPFCFAYCLTGLVLRSLEAESHLYLKWRREFLALQSGGSNEAYQSRCSVLVERLPSHLRSDAKLEAYFKTLVGADRVHSAVVYLDLRDLEAKLRKRDRAAKAFQRRLASVSARISGGVVESDDQGASAALVSPRKAETERLYFNWLCRDSGKRSPEVRAHRVGRGCCWVTVDAKGYRAAVLDAANAAFVEARDRALADERADAADDRETAASSVGLDDSFFFDASPLDWLSQRLFSSSRGGAAAGGRQDGGRPENEVSAPPENPVATADDDGGDGADDLEEPTTTEGDADPTPRFLQQTQAVSKAILDQTTASTVRVVRHAGRVTTTTIGGLAATLALDDVLMTRSYERSSTGVVTFVNPGTAADVAQLALTSRPLGLEASGPLPPPSDMIWQNVGVPAGALEWRKLLADGWLWLAALAWTPLIAALQAVSNLSEMAKVFPPLRPFVRKDRYAYVRSVVTGLIPVALLLGLLALVPILLERVAQNYVGLKSQSQIQRFVLSRNFYFQLLSIFVTILAGSLSATLKAFLKHPRSLVKLLGKSLPTISAYFMQTLCVKALFSLSWELARPLPYLVSSASTKLAAAYRTAGGVPVVDREESAGTAPEFRVGYTGPEFLMVVLIGMTYAPIAPVILPIALLFFALADAVFSRNFLFVYVNAFEGGAVYLWPALTYMTVLALCASHLTLISYLTLLGGVHQAPLLVPLPILTVLFHRRLVRFYEAPGNYLDRETAVRFHLHDDLPLRRQGLRADLYRHPALVAPDLDARAVEHGFFRTDSRPDLGSNHPDNTQHNPLRDSSSSGGRGAFPTGEHATRRLSQLPHDDTVLPFDHVGSEHGTDESKS